MAIIFSLAIIGAAISLILWNAHRNTKARRQETDDSEDYQRCFKAVVSCKTMADVSAVGSMINAYYKEHGDANRTAHLSALLNFYAIDIMSKKGGKA